MRYIIIALECDIYVFVCIMNKKQMNKFVEKIYLATKDLYRHSPMDLYRGDFGCRNIHKFDCSEN